RASLDRLKRDFERRFPPQRIIASELQRLVVTFHERNLVYSGIRGQGAQLLRRRGEGRRREWLQKLTNPLAFRLRGIDPDRFLTQAHSVFGWLFHPAFVACWAVLMIATALLCFTHWDEILGRLPRLEEYLTPTNLVWLAATTAAVKVVHELGHGLACKHYGGEVRELGLMFLMFAPCLYCNASDAWMFRSKWRRAAVGAAGIYFESILAGAAVWIWWSATPGAVRDTALNVAVICSVSTLIFNGNPLLRFDGYYVFSDLVAIPNLAEKAGLFWRRALGSSCLGIVYPSDFQLPENRKLLLGTYGAASLVYRWFLTISIMGFLYGYFRDHHLTSVFFIVAGLGFLPRLARQIWKGWKAMSNVALLPQVKRGRCAATAATVLVVLAAFFLVPLPNRIYCPAEIVPAGETAVYAETAGVLKEVARRLGDQVSAGELILRLENLDAERERRSLQAKCDEYEAQLDALQRNQYQDTGAALEIAVVTKALAASRRLLEERTKDVRRLRIVAPVSGSVLPPPESKTDQPEAGALPNWHGFVFDPQNLGCGVESGTMVCCIGDVGRFEAELVVEHADWELVRVGQHVEIMLPALPGRRLEGAIVELAEANLQSTPKRLSHAGGGELASKTDRDGVERPRHTSYYARVELVAEPLDATLIRAGVRGQAKVFAGRATAYAMLDRYLRNLLTFKL
ncbi:MAG: hypothetical protein J0M17_08750, partial [Planctomycetes bacterium]|nr:hypothetical protein [Planctomycetota bacterium]